MKSFLETLAEDILEKYGREAGSLTLVFPNRRAGLFFADHLAGRIDAPVWSPAIYSIEDFILKFSPLQVADRISLIFDLYEVYRKATPIQEDFDRFYYWGELLLNDFDETDKYLVNAELLFRDLVYQKELDLQYDYLAPEQKEAILTFWSSFKSKLSRHQQDFLAIWKALHEVYRQYRQSLSDKGAAYAGMIYRQIAEDPESFITVDANEKIIFAGLNALTTAEEKIVRHLIVNHKAEVVWDLDAAYMDNPLHEAGYFLRKYLRDPAFAPFFKKPFPGHLKDGDKNIRVFAASSESGQVKKAAEILDGLARLPGWNPRQTALILPDEKLLFPALNSLPESLPAVNITMGYPLRDTPAYHFVESLIALHATARESAGKRWFYYKPLLQVVRHIYFFNYNAEAATRLAAAVESRNLIHVEAGEAARDPSYPDIFKKIKDSADFFAALRETLVYITSSAERSLSDIEQEYIFHLGGQINRLEELLSERNIRLDLKTFSKIFRQAMQSARIPFTGEPLDGLQVMGALETRNLDFENVFILSFNEGSYPRSSHLHSFIPFNLRKGYGLPTFEQQDSIYAYNFYRLLQKAQNVFIFYHTGGENGGLKEMSRYLYQLVYESDLALKRAALSSEIRIESSPPIVISKNQSVQNRLRRYLKESGAASKALAPSAINMYLDCRLKFYYRYVADLYEADQVKEEVDPVVFGKLLHAAMEKIYEDFLNQKEALPLDIEALKGAVDNAVEYAFKAEYGVAGDKTFELAGRNIIVAEIIKKMAHKILDKDVEYAPFRVLGLEGGEGAKRFEGAVPILLNGKTAHVALKGIVDRIDEKEGAVRIIDYKTGRDDKKIEDIPSLFNRDHPRRNKAAMQTILYSLIYSQSFQTRNKRIVPAVFNIRELFDESFDYRLQIKKEQGRGHDVIADVAPYLPRFEAELKKVLEEIFDPATPFEQTDDEKKCRFCPYAGICSRG